MRRADRFRLGPPRTPAPPAGDAAPPAHARRLASVFGPGLLVAVGYMDPGNWATDIAAGSRFGFGLLFVVVAASLGAILLQSLALRLGLVAGLDLAQACRRRYGRAAAFTLWALAEIAIVATDIAEVLGGALALKLLLGFPLWAGILVTAFDMLLVVGLRGRGYRRIEAIIAALVATITLCFVFELVLSPPDVGDLARGLIPDLLRLRQPGALALAIGIVGATVMPHNLYLHSSIVQTRLTGRDPSALNRTLRLANADLVISLTIAMFVNAAILALAASAFHGHGHTQVTEIDQAYRLLSPVTGAGTVAVVFGIALLASGQSSTFTGTIAGQIVLEGFLDLKLPFWQRRLVTRLIAIVPALIGVLLSGDSGVGPLLVGTQIVLSLQLPFAIWPLIRAVSDRGLMGRHRPGAAMLGAAWATLAVISAANVWLIINIAA